MSIETLDDILTELADKLGIYGAHGESDDPDEPGKPCRMCFESDLRERILAAIEIENKLYGSLVVKPKISTKEKQSK